MSSLAFLLFSNGIPVRGCDARKSSFTRKLSAAGIRIKIGEEEIAGDTVVYTEAVDVHEGRLAEAARAGKRLLPRAELLGRIAEDFPHVLSVAGCHGKTSTTAMLAHVFRCAGKRFTCHLGGEDRMFGNFASFGDEFFLTEACEFRRSFLHLKSETALVLNTDYDHTDCYRSRGELNEAYAHFVRNAKRAVVGADDPFASRLPHAQSFGIYSGKIRACDLFSDHERYAFTVTENGVPVVRIRLHAAGKMQVLNALAAYSAAELYGIAPQQIKEGLESFRGVKRRFECVGTLFSVPVICDYAHHPREIEAAYETACGLCPGTVRTVFQPHTFTRTRDLMDGFVSVLKKMTDPIVYRTYAAREGFLFEGSAPALVSRVPEAIYVQSPQNLKMRLKELIRPDDLVLVLGAGDIYETVCSVVQGEG